MEILHYLIISLLVLSSLSGLMMSIVLFVYPKGVRMANVSYALLLLTFSLGCADVFLLRTQILGYYIHVYHLPLWFTLSFGPLLFYAVKFSLFPNYQFRGTDAKHLIMPILQTFSVLYFVLQPKNIRMEVWESFIRPIYGPLEYSFFLVSLFIYTVLSYRYIRYKIALSKRRGEQTNVENAQALRVSIKYFSIFATLYSFFAVTDFIAYRFFFINLYEVPGFTFFGDIMFSAMLLWLVIRAKVLLRNTKQGVLMK